MSDLPLLLIAAVLFLIIGGAWMAFYWRVGEPWLRRQLGRLLGVNIYMSEERIWQIEDQPVDSANWRNMLVRPLQIVSLMAAVMVPLVIVLIAIALLGNAGAVSVVTEPKP